MPYDRQFATTWQLLMDSVCTVMGLNPEQEPPIILSSLPDLPYQTRGRAPLSFIQGPPGRNIALAIGLRAALPNAPLVLIMNADSVTLGTNHLIHAARRNFDMTLLLLRAELTAESADQPLDRMRWGLTGQQQILEAAPAPLNWVMALGAAFVGRGSIQDPDGLATIIQQAIQTPGFAIVGVTDGANLPLGVLSRTEWPEYFSTYRAWAAPLAGAGRQAHRAPAPAPTREVPRCEVRMAGLGGHGIKLAGTVLSEAAGLIEGLWATQRGDYGSATRGGPSSVDVIIGSAPITYPGADHPDVLVALSQAAADRHARFLKPGGRLVIDPAEVSRPPAGALAVPVAALAREHAGKAIAAGMVAVGCVAALSEAVSLEALRQSVVEHVPRATAARNVAALEAGYAAARRAAQGDQHA